jgi:hypothetical protein
MPGLAVVKLRKSKSAPEENPAVGRRASAVMTDWKKTAQDAWSGWKAAAVEYHESRGDRPVIVEIEPQRLKRLRRLMDPAVWLEHANREISGNRPTPKVTVEAVILTVRERGLAALKEPANIERLSRCDDAAKAEIERRIAKLRKD